MVTQPPIPAICMPSVVQTGGGTPAASTAPGMVSQAELNIIVNMNRGVFNVPDSYSFRIGLVVIRLCPATVCMT